ncbi:MAG: hypothetical protein GXO33_00320 [Epsilonproteobacteria bacterium]|nr:hypothetical protein [Campylobacterota bacterium]
MKRLCCVKWFLPVLLLTALYAAEGMKSAIVYYGGDVSWPMVGAHDFIILEPSRVETATHGFKSYRKKVYAYVSVGEARKRRAWYKDINASWILGENRAWGSRVMDLSNPDYRKFLVNRVFAPLYEKGYRNFFLDTLDSYKLIAKPAAYGRFEEGLVALIGAVKRRFPDAGLILNRGFEIIDRVADKVDAVLFESYFRGLGGEGLAYVKKSDADRAWLDGEIAKVRRHGIPVIAVDYMQNPFSKEAERVRMALIRKGLIPYITDRDLNRYGNTFYRVQKREVLLLYNGEGFEHVDGENTGAHLISSLPLEYMGYIPVLRDIRRGLPTGHPEDRYAGVVIHVNQESENGTKIADWITKQASRGLRTAIVFLWPSLEDGFFEKLGVRTWHNPQGRIASQRGHPRIEVNRYHDFEMKPVVLYHDTYLDPVDGEPTFRYKDAEGRTNTLAAVMPWGGYCVDESFVIELGTDSIWIADPFRLFKETLRLKDLPVPDPTTENGRRLLFTHIDGDGIMNRSEYNRAYSGEIIYEKVLKHYKIPHSVSVIGAEIMPNGLYPEESPKLIALAKKIFALPNVEPATHMFSHPFVWNKIKPDGSLDPQYRLDVPGYRFSLDNDIKGSLDFITRHLLPKGKAPARLIFWSGDCMPTERVLRYVYRNDYLNLNGGDTYITKDHPWMSYIAPFGIKKGAFWQIYTGEQNENVYTHEFHGPFWGFKKVVQTFEMTDEPRRFKPIDIYYHFYSGSKVATLSALTYVFDWALAKPVLPLYASDYVKKVMAFYDASIAKTEKGEWIISGMGEIRTIRLEGTNKRVLHGSDCVGHKAEKGRTYWHFDGNETVRFQEARTPEQWELRDANGRVVEWQRGRNGGKIRLKGYVPLIARFALARDCRIEATPRPWRQSRENGVVEFRYKNEKEASFHVSCR